MRRTISMVALVLATWAGVSRAADDTLCFSLGRSELVVLGSFTSELLAVSDELGVVDYSGDFKVEQVLKGDARVAGKTMKVSVVRFEMGPDDKHPLVAKAGRCILMLTSARGATPAFVTADEWFGVQPPWPWLARDLKRLSGARR